MDQPHHVQQHRSTIIGLQPAELIALDSTCEHMCRNNIHLKLAAQTLQGVYTVRLAWVRLLHASPFCK